MQHLYGNVAILYLFETIVIQQKPTNHLISDRNLASWPLSLCHVVLFAKAPSPR
jgi:hypothetical protein